MDFSTKIIQTMGKMIAEEMQRCGFNADTPLKEVEEAMREMQRQIGVAGLAEFLEEADAELHEEVKTSSEKAYYFHSYRPAVIWSVFGKIRFTRRYYRYRSPRKDGVKGFSYLDQKMGFSAGEVTPGLAELLALEGVSTPFEETAKKIEKFLLFPISDNTVRKETERFGFLQDEIEQEMIRQSQDTGWLQKREREEKKVIPGRIYGSIDGFMAPLREGWKEFKVLAWYNVEEIGRYAKKRHHGSSVGEQKPLQAENITYHCDKLEPEAFGRLFWATGIARQADFYEERVFIGDGAKWIWNMIGTYYPNATQILDWYHASQYLYRIAEEAFEPGSEDYKHWIENTKTLLWEGEVASVIAECNRLAERPALAKVVHAAVTFYENNRKRMDYARFRKEGYFIGSGTIESAAKRLGELRLKEAGARWSRDGAVYTAKARAAWLSNRDQWHAIAARRTYPSLPIAL